MGDDIGRWLQRVRPETAADENWSTSSEADQLLAAIHRRTSGVSRRRTAHHRNRAARLLPAGVIAAAAAAVVAVAMTSSSTPTRTDHGFALPHGGGSPLVVPPLVRPAAYLLNTEPNCTALLDQLHEHSAASVAKFGTPGYFFGGGGNDFQYSRGSFMVDTTALSAVTTPARASVLAIPSDTSGTNVQENGVDEPDIVKTDGDRLITITDGVLRVIDTATRTVTGTLDLSIYNGFQNAQLLVAGTHALVILNSFGYAGSGGAQSTYLFVDLSGRPTVTGSLRASGVYVDARMLGTTVRLVVGSTPTINLPSPYARTSSAKSANQKVINDAPLSAWLPKYTLSSPAGSTTGTVPCGRVSHPADFTGSSMLTIYTLNMDELAKDPTPVTVAADGNTVYANADSLYIASNAQWFCCQTAKQNTEFHRFDIRGSGAPTYLGSGTVPGRLLSSYSLSDDGQYLRVATTTGGNKTGIGNRSGSSSSIYVVSDDSLSVVGHVGDLGNGEQIYAVRFVGTTAYVVTYRQTDPLYVIDLRNPRDPRTAGSLEMSGVTSYLHDVGDGRLVGVGQTLTAGEGAGVQVSLFDVSAASAPKRVANLTVPKTPWYLQFDPHTFLYWQPTGLIVVPLRSWDGATQSGRVLAVRLDGQHLTKVGIVSNPRPTAVPDDGQGIQRSVIVDGQLWTISGGGVQISDQSNLHPVAWLAFG